MTNEAKALVVVSSFTGNTRIVGHWLADAYAAGVLYTPETAPLISRASAPCFGFLVRQGDAPEDMKAFAARVTGKTIGTFITMGAEPEDLRALAWAKKSPVKSPRWAKATRSKQRFCARAASTQRFLTA